MLDRQLSQANELYKMFRDCPNISASILSLARRVIEMIHAEGLDPRTVEFVPMIPKGEKNKLFIVLQAAEYSDGAPIELPEETKDSPSLQLSRKVNSLYKAIGKDNEHLISFITLSPGLADLIYSTTNYMFDQHYKNSKRDFRRPMSWDVFDHHEDGDLVISGIMET